MTDLWDWADVAAVGYIVGLYVGATPANVLMGYVPGPRSQFAAAIRYGYEQGQRDAERATHVTAVATSEFDWDRYFPLNPQPESTVAQDEPPVAASGGVDCVDCGVSNSCLASAPVATSEFPRVWVERRAIEFLSSSGPRSANVAFVDNHDHCEQPHEYVHISELERLREAAGRAMHRALCMASEAISPDISDAIRAEFTRVFGVATVALGETAEDAMATRYVPHDQLEAVEGERNAWRDDANYQLACLADRKRELEAAQKRIAELTEERDAAVREMAKARSKAQDSDGDCVVAWALASEYAADRGGQFARLFDMLTMARRALKKDAARIAELEQEVRRLRHLIAIDRTGLAAGLDKVRSIVDGFAWLANDGEWGSYDYTNHSSETLRAEIGACFDQVGEVIEATLKASGDRADSAAQNMGEAYPPRCKDGCEHWRAPLGEFFQHAACMHKSGLKLPNDDGSDSCSNHSKLQK